MEIRDHLLVLGGLSAADLVKEFGSPLYVYEEDVLRAQARRLRKALPDPFYRPRYSVKANTNPHILTLALEEGLEMETVSPGEIALALALGAPASRVHYTSSGMSREEMSFALERGVSITVDSLSNLALFASLKPGGAVWVRLNPGEGAGHHDHVVTGGPKTKFGVPVEHVDRLLAEAKALGVRIAGIHMHIGSNFLDPAPFLAMVDVLLKAALRFPGLEGVCVGGGFGVAYRPGQRNLDLEAFAPELGRRFAAFRTAAGRDLSLAVEPGRFLVCEAGVLLARVTAVQQGLERTFVITDTGFNHLIRPAMYQAYHPILHAGAADAKPAAPVDVCGNICETGDIFQRDFPLPPVKEGDVLAITHAGAYGFTMASTYNTRPLPAEVMVKDGKGRIVRKRQTPEGLAAAELERAGL